MLVKSFPSPSVILICFLLLKRMFLLLLFMKWMELIGQLQEERMEKSFLSNRTSQRFNTEPQPAPSSRPEWSHFTKDTGLAVCSLHTLFLSRQSQISSQSPPQMSALSCSLKYMELMYESVWKGVRNLPSSRLSLQTSLTEAEMQRLALQGLYSRSRGQWGILVLQCAPYWAWKAMVRSFCAMAILLQSSERILNLTTSQSSPLRHLRDSSAVSNILICGAQIPAATIQRSSLEISTWLVEISNWKSWMSSILLRYYSSYLRDLLDFCASLRNWEQVLPADMLQVFTPLISVTLYINNLYYNQYSQFSITAFAGADTTRNQEPCRHYCPAIEGKNQGHVINSMMWCGCDVNDGGDGMNLTECELQQCWWRQNRMILQSSINIHFLNMRTYAAQAKISSTSEEDDYYFLQPMFQKHPPNELLSTKHAPDLPTQVKLITAKDERRNNVQYYPPKSKNAEMQAYAALFGIFDSLGWQYADRMTQIVYFKCNNTKYNLLPQSTLKSRILSAFYIPFQQIQRNLPNLLPINAHYCRDPSVNSKCNRGCSFDPIFFSNYQSANLFAAFRKNPYEYDLILQNDINSCQTINWFNFTVQFCQEGYYSFKIVNLTQDMTRLYERGMKIAYCYINSQQNKQDRASGQGWGFCGNNIRFTRSHLSRENKTGQKYYQLYFQFKCKNKKDTIMFSTDVPYTSVQAQKFFNKVLLRKFKNMIKVERQQFGKSVSGSSLVSYIIKRKRVRDSVQVSPLASQTQLRSKDKRKSSNLMPINRSVNYSENNSKSIVIMGRVGGSDIGSSYTIEGMVEYLVDSLQVEPMKRVFDFYFIPLVNPDAVRYGHSLSNLTGSLINNNWKTPNRQFQPETYYLKEYLQQISKESTISLILNLTTQRQDIFSSVIGMRKGDEQSEDSRIFPFVLSKRYQYFSFQRSIFYPKGQNSSMSCVLNELYPKSLVYQLKISHFEASSKYEDSPSIPNEGELRQSLPQHYRAFGKDIISSYLEHAKLYDKNILLRDKWIKQIQQFETKIVQKKHCFVQDTKVQEKFPQQFYEIRHQCSITPVFKSSNALISSKFINTQKIFEPNSISKDYNKISNKDILQRTGNQMLSKRNKNDASLKKQINIINSKPDKQENSEKQISLFKLGEKKTSILLNCPQNSLTFEIDEVGVKQSSPKQELEKQLLKKQLSTKMLRKVKIEDTLSKWKTKGTAVKMRSGQFLNHS